MTQLVRIEPGNNVEEAHMRNRQLIARLGVRERCGGEGCGIGKEGWEDVRRDKRL